MKYLSVAEVSLKWDISERSVRNYCNKGRIEGAILNGKTWLIPDNIDKPKRQIRHTLNNNLLDILIKEMNDKTSCGIYHKFQVELTYNSNHIEGSKLSKDQTRFIFETKTIGENKNFLPIDDVIETSNHFRCVDLAIQSAKTKLSEPLIKQFHYLLKNGTSDSFKSWIKIGDYKMIGNEVGGIETTKVEDVKNEIKELLLWYNSIKDVKVNDIIEFHYRFERIHPFSDGNGRVGRLIMLKECLKHNIVPIIIFDEYKAFYYRGLKEWPNQKGYLIDTCLLNQDIVKKYLDSFDIKYDD